ncbi:glutamyl-Q tRNA(Asp) synthetase [Tistlia consotensis]|uniref:Glutamyl-Q tRNA(Asp) synthetase n=1 Tax=Tistlia consotensis USBA 355 TaxID=560819 RepID=A0A1Y6B933_9PROT|nr:tRNA glutamyl-Q(34) synthetase GluQRS [Tistlia consotensis]SME97884.1 glutamyl-Q tRNA(Asp) synthetase [Tistlia consotensis USBA 355]SNR57255.1 glutamyl-Q tRNA(Asp) synthetase [Tistlia consotensis]
MLETTPPETTRFAPSPTGLLHLGHAHSALFAARAAGPTGPGGGRFLLRIEDIDRARCRPLFEAAILEDLAWLGLRWEQPVRRQSDHLDDYAAALARLEGAGLLYPCFCTRREIAEEIARSARAPHGPEGPLYPGTCRRLDPAERAARRAAGEGFALRLDVEAAVRRTGPLTWHDAAKGEIRAAPESLGDVVLARRDIGTSYHLAVTVDDALQGVTLVTRGEDLFHATHVHRLLQALLDLPVPRWHHHGLLADETGRRLAKRHDALAVAALREAGKTPQEVRAMAGFG